jgi:hypothetical protein
MLQITRFSQKKGTSVQYGIDLYILNPLNKEIKHLLETFYFREKEGGGIDEVSTSVSGMEKGIARVIVERGYLSKTSLDTEIIYDVVRYHNLSGRDHISVSENKHFSFDRLTKEIENLLNPEA